MSKFHCIVRTASLQTRVAEAAGPRMDLLPQRLDVGIARKAQLEVLEFLA
eukprot:CAMPEP_0183388690 /NCGR_PEP_ID=MMETSP0370-20130417/4303_1 /TAXON_ID=268820 /ORGANISM="Peridinium aciculiferum, Strain PAER-2" /LENGTH=49 /DNA_ID= /DNA_START= /DNA_END= /DNA_ORIENTATION=